MENGISGNQNISMGKRVLGLSEIYEHRVLWILLFNKITNKIFDFHAYTDSDTFDAFVAPYCTRVCIYTHHNRFTGPADQPTTKNWLCQCFIIYLMRNSMAIFKPSNFQERQNQINLLLLACRITENVFA